MARLASRSTLFFSLFASNVFAAYDQFFFTTNATKYFCPTIGFGCAAPQACAHDSVLDKYYCCDPGKDAVCWSGDTGCPDGNARANEQQCGDDSYHYCCLDSKREECTSRTNQINICWAIPENLLANATVEQLNKTYSSLSSANPSATSLVFEIAQLFPSSSSSSIPSSTSATSTPATSPTSSSTNLPANSPATTPPPSSDSGLSGGAKAGIAIAAVAGVAIIAAAAFFLWRRNRNQADHTSELDSNPYVNGHMGYGAVGSHSPQEKYAHELQQPPVELDARPDVVELGTTKPANENDQQLR